MRYYDPSGHFWDPVTGFILAALIGTSLVDATAAAKETYDNGGSFLDVIEAFATGGFEGLCKAYTALSIDIAAFSIGDLFTRG